MSADHVCKYYEPRYMFYFKKCTSSKLARLHSVKIRVIFGVRFERRKVDKKSKPTRKLKHANSILEYFEYFCMASKLVLTILSYTVSKLTRFFETQCSYTTKQTADYSVELHVLETDENMKYELVNNVSFSR